MTGRRRTLSGGARRRALGAVAVVALAVAAGAVAQVSAVPWGADPAPTTAAVTTAPGLAEAPVTRDRVPSSRSAQRLRQPEPSTAPPEEPMPDDVPTAPEAEPSSPPASTERAPTNGTAPPPAERTPTNDTAPPAQPTPPPAPEPLAPERTSGFPDATTTGVPAGTALTPSGSLTITEDGAVIDGLEITGTVTVEADDVTIRRTVIRNTGDIPIRVIGNGLLVEDSEIDGQGRGNPAIGYNDYTLRRVNIHHVAEGPRIAGGDVTIEDSYIHHLVQVGDNHTDAIQLVGGDNVVIRGNTVLAHNPDTGIFGNAAFQFGEEDGPVRACLVEGNLMDGGNYTVNGGGGGGTGAQCTFRGNQFQQNSRYGVRGNLGPGVVWESSNIWHSSGQAVA